MAVTLSIGIGLNAATYIQNYEYARIAIEMALGRGGDQVVIKNENNITYIGGKAQQMEKSTRVKARVKAQALKEFMSTKDRVVVMGHKITDVDALGAGIGIYRAGKTLGKPVHIVINDPTTSIRPLMSGFMENPDYEPSMFVDSNQAKELVDNNKTNHNQENKEIGTMKKTMKIEGMMCGHCEATVKKALEGLDGVTSAEVSHEAGTAVVELSADVADDVLKKTVEDKDYKVTAIN